MISVQSIQLNRYRVTFTFGTGPPSAHLRDEPRGAKNGAFINTPASGLLTNREQRMKNPEEIHVFGKRGRGQRNRK
ncbi:hypothetical protein ATANTOWER_023233 [Ataeniobius toweri]|uniref:Uncharacterized protein n=1 Tax=Ataeniobius toweri TaxID=208326 RepID=A0ABU7B2K0_9TELE|nr:hypothetical protein [Ataeniobius toweri]